MIAHHSSYQDATEDQAVSLHNEPISKLAPFSGIILTISLALFFLVRYYVFEGFMLRRCYGHKYLDLDETDRRGFVNHHVAGLAKIVMLLAGSYPFFEVTFGTAKLHTPYAGSPTTTMGDVLIVLTEIFVSMYIFELLFRAKLSPVAVAHHIGAIDLTQSSVTTSLSWAHKQDATIAFLVCFVWGTFDVIAEFWPHVSIILYRMYPRNHGLLCKVFQFACIITFIGTLCETVIVMWVFGSEWTRWTLSFRIAIPILHAVFCAAQVWGTRNFRAMWLRQRKLLREQRQSDGLVPSP